MPEMAAPPGAPPAAPPPTAGGAGGAPPTPQGPTAPATVAPDSAGLRMRGMVLATMHLNGLEEASKLLGGTKTPEGMALMKAIIALRKTFGGASNDLQSAEHKLMGSRIAPVSPPNAQQGAALQTALKSRLGGMGMQPGAPAPTGG